MTNQPQPSGSDEEPQLPRARAAAPQKEHFQLLVTKAHLADPDLRAQLRHLEAATAFAQEWNMHAEARTALSDLAEAYRLHGRYTQALATLRKLVQMQNKALGPEHPSVAYTYMAMARVHADVRQLDEAVRCLRNATLRFQLAEKLDSNSFVECLCMQADIYRQAGRIELAKTAVKQAYEVLQNDDSQPMLQAKILEELASLLSLQHRFDAAIDAYTRVVRLKEKVLGQGDQQVAVSLTALAMCYFDKHETAFAEPYLLQAAYILKRSASVNPRLQAEILYKLGGVYRAQGRFREGDAVTIGADELLGRTNRTWKVLYGEVDRALKAEERGDWSAVQSSYRKILLTLEPLRDKHTAERIAILARLARATEQRGQMLQMSSLVIEMEDELQAFFGMVCPDQGERALRLARLVRLQRGKDALADGLYWLAERYLRAGDLTQTDPHLVAALQERIDLLIETERFEEADTVRQSLHLLTDSTRPGS